MYRAVLDTCAIVPGLQRDFLLQLAAEEAYAPLWGTGILHELDYVLERLHSKRDVPDSRRRRQYLFEQMERAFPGALIDAPKDGKYDYGLLDVDDGHVAHAAIIGKADAIVTDDTRAGFRTAPVLLAASIEVVSPAEFTANSAAAHPAAALRALEAVAARRDLTQQSLLTILNHRYRMTELESILSPSVAASPAATARHPGAYSTERN